MYRERRGLHSSLLIIRQAFTILSFWDEINREWEEVGSIAFMRDSTECIEGWWVLNPAAQASWPVARPQK